LAYRIFGVEWNSPKHKSYRVDLLLKKLRKELQVRENIQVDILVKCEKLCRDLAQVIDYIVSILMLIFLFTLTDPYESPIGQ
jgi:hypothetical protein